jgi:glycerol-3-phosphate dehydrogenase (NAD(P)+)
MRSAVLGAGSWGTALGATLASKGFTVTLWDKDVPVLDDVAQKHENTRYLPGVQLPPKMGATPDLARALEGAELVVLAVPSQAMRIVAIESKRLLHAGVPICSVAKGIEVDTLMTMSEVLEDVLPVQMHPYLTFLSGPSFANVVAIAAGLPDGMGFGANARAALITRGLAEIGRLAVRKGANPMTLAGLAGLGDLVLTCSSDMSRNHTVGFELGRGRKLEDIQQEIGQVVEGVLNAKSTHALARKLAVEMPISEMVYRVLYEGQAPHQAVSELMTRETKSEN